MTGASTQTVQRRLPLFGKTLAVSIVFHLSAITLFSIVIYYPRQSAHYFRLSLVQEAPAAPPMPSVEPAIVAALTGGRNTAGAANLDLPKLSFDPQGPLGLGKLSVGGRSFFEAEQEAAPDSWARFGTGIQRVRASLLGLTGLDSAETPDTAGGTATTTLALGSSLRATVEWGGAAPRELLFAPPALLATQATPALGATATTEEFLITIDAVGAVMRVFKISPGQSTFGDEAIALLERCRFAALSQGAGISTGTIRIAPAAGSTP